MVEAPNVTPIREQVAAPMASAESGARSGQRFEDEDALGLEVALEYQKVANGGPTASDLASTGMGGFESPFEDELETPAFLRKGGLGSFMRRGGD